MIGQFWLYTLLRIALFGALWGVLWLINVRGMLGLLIAVLLSVPLSFVLLARPRAALAASLEQRVSDRKAREDTLRARLAGEQTDADATDTATAATSADTATSGETAPTADTATTTKKARNADGSRGDRP